MRRVLIFTCMAFVFLFVQMAAPAQQPEAASSGKASVASVPRLIQFNGMVRDRSGEPLGGVAARLTFSVYEELQGGAALWTESQVIQLDEQGRYTVLLGATSSEGVPVELFPAGKARWLGVQVENRDEDPRVLMVSVPYALKAEDAEKLGGKRASDFVLAEQLDQKVRTAVAVLLPAESTTAPTGKALAAAPAAAAPKTTPATSFADTTATQVVSVQQNGTGDALTAATVSTTAGKAGVRGQATGATGLTFGVQGTNASNAGTGVSGVASLATGNTIGVSGQVNSPNGIAALFWNSSTSPAATTRILSGKSGAAGTEKFSVDNVGRVRAFAYLDMNGHPTGTGGTVTSVLTGPGLTGGPITNTGTLDLNTGFTDARYSQLNHTHTVGDVTGAATLGTNTFVGLQTITGNLNLTGAINSNGLRIDATPDGPNVIVGSPANYVASGLHTVTISGGGEAAYPNRVTDVTGTIGGGAGNQVGDDAGTLDDACCGTVAGGIFNLAKGGGSTIGGGVNNVAAGPGWTSATIGGGDGNKADGWASTVAGGSGNAAKGTGATVTGGSGNTAGGSPGSWGDTVGGGTGNIADGVWATVPGGNNNTAGFASFAAGTNAKATSGGSFVWGDASEGNVTDAGWNTFVVRATGGAFFSSNLTAGGIVAAPAFFGDGSALTGVPRLVGGNIFGGDQGVNGNLNLSGAVHGSSANFDSPPGTNTDALVVTQHTDGQDVKGINASIASTADNAAAVYGHAEGGSGPTFGVSGENVSPDGIGVGGQADSESGGAVGVRGTTKSEQGHGVDGIAQDTATQGVGVAGVASAGTGYTIGVAGSVASSDGVAGKFTNITGGKILSGNSPDNTEVFFVNSEGVHASAYRDLNGIPIGGVGGTVTSVEAGPGLTGGTITSSGTLSLDTFFTDARYAAQTALNAEAVTRTNADLTLDGAKVSKGGDTMTGPLNLPSLAASGSTNTSGSAVVAVTQSGGLEPPEWNSPAAVRGDAGDGAIGVRGLSGNYVGVFGEGSIGVAAHGHGPNGQAVFAYGTSYEGSSTGILAEVRSPAGVAGLFNNIAGGTILSGHTTGYAEVFRVDAGGVRAIAYRDLEGNPMGGGGTATGLDCAGCVGNQQLGINYAESASQGGPATSALTAAEATNAAALGGFSAGSFARLAGGNAFAGDQNITGNLSLQQLGTGSALTAQASGTDPWTAAIQGENTAETGTTVGVAGTSRSADGRGVWAIAASTTGTTYGVYGQASSPDGVGTLGIGQSTIGANTGVWGESLSLEGVAGVFINRADGKLLSGRATHGEVFSVDGYGNIATIGNVTANGHFFGDGSGLTNLNAGNIEGAVTQTQLTNDLAAEAAPRIAADDNLANNISTEIAARQTADGLLQGDISARATFGANTFGGTQTIDSGNLSLTGGNIFLPATSGVSAGAIRLGGTPFLHACCSPAQYNTFVGSYAGNFNTTGSGNTASGSYALYSNTEGYDNTAIGREALRANTTGRSNTAIGRVALYYNTTGGGNTASGDHALFSNTEGLSNTAIGSLALEGNTTGQGNTALGNGSGYNNTTGTFNTFIGTGTAAGVDGLTNATAIGGGASVWQSNALILGNNADVGIGTGAPVAKLHVAGDIRSDGTVTATSFVGAFSGTVADVNCAGCVNASDTDFAAALETGLSNEVAARESGDAAVQANLAGEIAARTAADTTAQDNLNAEASARTTADSSLQSAIDGRAVLAGGNNFIGNQNIAGSLFVVGGSINGALRLETGGFSPNVIAGSGVNYATLGLSGGTIGGGGFGEMPNRVTDYFGTVAGGINNQAGDNAGDTNDRGFATVGGGFGNIASNAGATVGGGQSNSAAGASSTVSGGSTNSATEQYSAVGGGSGNTASGDHAVVGGGQDNTAVGLLATVGGGVLNIASNQFAVIGGGNHNQVSGAEATVGGGHGNVATGNSATIPGGVDNTAQGYQSFAAGTRAKALHDGSFVWGDGLLADVASTGPNQFIARASGGVTFYTDGAVSSGVTVAAGGGSWSSLSDRNVKDNFIPVDGHMLLARLMELPLFTWNYRTQKPSIRHIGPMAQDFRAAFNLGEDEKHISTVDADGVSLAAIQALYQLSLEKDKKIDQLTRDLDALRAEVEQLKRSIAK